MYSSIGPRLQASPFLSLVAANQAALVALMKLRVPSGQVGPFCQQHYPHHTVSESMGNGISIEVIMIYEIIMFEDMSSSG